MITNKKPYSVSDAEYTDTEGLEALTGISSSTWAKRRLSGDTPPYMKVGKSVRYHVPTAKAWLARRTRRSTSDPGEEVDAATDGDGGPA